MLALGFLNPWVLWLLPLALIPIIIHLLNRRRFNKVRWAAMEFLLAAMKRNRRRMRMEQWLILLLRTLAVLLLVFLVARPRLDEGVFGGVTKHHVVCVDDSASLAQRGAASTAFEDAGEAVHALATRLATSRDGDLLTVMLASNPEQPVVPVTRVTAGLPSRIREEIGKWQVSDAQFDPATSLAAMTRMFEANEDAEHVEYYLVSDMRKHDWLDDSGEANAAAQKWLLARNAETERVTFLTVGSANSENLAITSVQCRERVCTAGLPLTFSIDVTNRGRATSTAGEVSVEFDERTRTSYPLPPLGAGATTTIELAHTFHTPGAHGIRASLPGDRFDVDDVRALSIDVREHSRVLVVDGDPGDTIEDSETYYLHAALEIRGSVNSGIEVRLIGEHELGDVSETELEDFDMVWLCNVARPNERAVERLDAFVRGGGGLALFLGNQVDIAHYNTKLFGTGEGLLPVRLLEIAGDIDEKLSVHLSEKDDPLFETNTEEVEFMFEQLVSVGRYVSVHDDPKAQKRVLLRMRDEEGPPLLISRDVGEGRTFLFTTSADAHWTSLPVWPVFVMTAVSMHRAAARPQDMTRTNLMPSSVASVALDPGRFKTDVTVSPFGDSIGDQRTFSAPPGDGSELQLEVPMADLDGYGLFELAKKRHDGAIERTLLARNCHVDEGRLERLSTESFRSIYPEELADRLVIQAGDGSAAADVALAGGSDIWRWVGIALLAGMLLETLLAWRFGRGR